MSDPTDNAFGTLQDIVKAARENLDDDGWDYVMGGADTETTLKRNRLALDKLAFRPRVLRDVSEIDVSAELFGSPLRIPVLLAPIGSLQDLHPEGGAESARGAAEYGVISILSSVCHPGLEKVADAAPGENRIFQLYVRGDDGWVDDHVHRAVDNGYTAFCLTVDLDMYGRRERDIAKGFLSTARKTVAKNEIFQEKLNWDHVKRFKDTHDIPLIIKGIATAEDTEIAVGIGVHGIHVSNHGGRQLDYGLGTMDMLPEVVEAAGGKAEIIIDGGFMRGTDVLKAVALGADAVAVGKLYGLGLAAGGEAGVARVLEIVEGEMLNAIALLGARSLDELGPELITRTEPVREASAVSAYPLIEIDQYHY